MHSILHPHVKMEKVQQELWYLQWMKQESHQIKLIISMHMEQVLMQMTLFETKAIKKALGEHAYDVKISSTKIYDRSWTWSSWCD